MERAELDQWTGKEVARLFALLENERHYYQELAANLPSGLLVVSNDLVVLSANRTFRRQFSVRMEDLLWRRLEDLMPLAGLGDRVKYVLTSGNALQGLEYDIPQEDGIRRVRISISGLRSWEEDTEFDALLLVEDLGVRPLPPRPEEQPEAAHEAAAPEAPAVEEAPAPPAEAPAPLAEAAPPPPPPPPPTPAVEEIPAIVWEADPAGESFLLRNRHAAAVLGYSEEQIAEEGFWLRVIAPEDRPGVLSFYRQAARATKPLTREYRVVSAAGRPVLLREIVHALRDKEGAVLKLVGVSIDVTQSRKLEDHRLETAKMEALGQAAGRMAHDFNNLLMVIRGYGEGLLHGLPLNSPYRGDVEEILRTSERVASLTGQLMSFTRRLPGEPQPLDLNVVVAGLESRIRSLLAPRAELVTLLEARPSAVQADRRQLEQVICALAGHLSSSMTARGRLSVITVNLTGGEDGLASLLPEGPYVALAVRDNSQVMDAETRQHLFEPFYTRELQREGIPGLFAVYGLVKQLGGHLWVESEPGLGTALTLCLPGLEEAAPGPVEAPAEEVVEVPAAEIPAPAAEPEIVPPPAPEAPVEAPAAEAPAPAPAPVPEAPPPPAPEQPAPAGTVLVVEDDAGIRALMRKILQREGFRVLEASGGEEAVQLGAAHQGAIHLLVTDLTMPVMTGRELAETLLAGRPLMKVLYVSGYTDDAAIHAGAFPPGTGFLQKPFTLGALVEKVRDVLAQ